MYNFLSDTVLFQSSLQHYNDGWYRLTNQIVTPVLPLPHLTLFKPSFGDEKYKILWKGRGEIKWLRSWVCQIILKVRAYPNSMCRWLQVITWSFQAFIYTKVPALKFKFAKLIALMIFSDRRLWAIHNCLRLALANSQKYFKKDKLSSFWNSVALLQKYKLRGLKGVYQTTDFSKFLLKLLSLGISRYLLPSFGGEGGLGGSHGFKRERKGYYSSPTVFIVIQPKSSDPYPLRG